MQTIEKTYVDKEGWPDGPWKNEPDKRQWLDPETKLPCLIVRGPLGALCGYVGVPKGHPWYQVDYDSVGKDPDVHGGLTFSDHCQEGEGDRKICHVVEEGEDDHVWWLGFDCAHCFDLVPGMGTRLHGVTGEDVYRDFDYVTKEVERLAVQALLIGM